MTANKKSGWFWGCGLGCVTMVLIAVGMGILSARFVKQTTEGFDTAVETRSTLEERFGETSEFVPSADGTVPPARMEAFLAIRETTTPSRERLTATFSAIPMSEEAAEELESQGFAEKMSSVSKIVRSSMGLGAEMGNLFAARNQALLEQEMGLGEYTYIYALVYYSWLGHSPTEGPEDADEGAGSVDIASSMGSAFKDRVRKDLLQMLRNQLESLPADTESEPWREQLEGEIAALQGDRHRVPWQDALPPQIGAAFEPFRARLEATYSPATNAMELGRNRRTGRLSVTAD